MSNNKLVNIIKDRNVLLISTSSPRYIRTEQIYKITMNHADKCDMIAPNDDEDVRPLSIPRLMRLCIKLIFTSMRNREVIIVAGVPQLLYPVLKFKKGKRILVTDYFISVYNTLVNDRKAISAGNPAAGLLRLLDRNTMLMADLVMADTGVHADYFENLLDAHPRDLEVLYLEPDLNVFKRDVEPYHFTGIEDKFKVLFFGTGNPLQGFDIVREAMMYFRDCMSMQFILVGPAELRKGLESNDNVLHLSDWLSQKELCRVILASDLVLVGHFSGDIEKASIVIPGKAYICNALGVRFILGDSPAVRERYDLFAENAILVKRGNADSLIHSVERCYDEWQNHGPPAESNC